ncbi:HpcH/HpaI aldolase/citrate lyase family protein [Streptomyces sp. NPDC058045]|uniref:HpcH/HpaI aldolase/citrate lyase family protein n=1 Tax=Streptomyces sp. NPDC058045 TaxID=3346311 RepID=UPI0036EF938D
MTGPAVPRSWLYVPGHRPERVAKALASGADAVVIDLEDAVPADRKDTARDTVTRLDHTGRPGLWVRVNDPRTPWGQADLAAAAQWRVDGIRLPRAEDEQMVRTVAARQPHPVQLLVETALGLSRAARLAAADPAVAGIGLGEADLAADLCLASPDGLDWARGQIVVAARAAGLPSPVQSVWTDVADLDGLRRSSRVGRAAGFHGRSIVHPRQIDVVHEVYSATAEEVRTARAVLRTAEEARARGESAVLDAEGRFIDPAVVEGARMILLRAGPLPDPAPTRRTIAESGDAS